jgi:hypothetical protein
MVTNFIQEYATFKTTETDVKHLRGSAFDYNFNTFFSLVQILWNSFYWSHGGKLTFTTEI